MRRRIGSPCRQGITLIEVLVAIFVMGIGLLALLALFPLGALRITKAVQDDRAAQMAQYALAVAKAKNLRNDPTFFPEVNIPSASGAVGERYQYDYFINPGMADYAYRLAKRPEPEIGKTYNNLMSTTFPVGPSYPVFFDPWGYFSTGGFSQRWIDASVPIEQQIPRLIPRFLDDYPSVNQSPTTLPIPYTKALLLYRWFTLHDDINFENILDSTNGTYPGTPRKVTPRADPYNSPTYSTFLIERDIRYSYAYCFHRPLCTNKDDVNMSVLVFNKRPLSTTASLALQEKIYRKGVQTVEYDYGLNSVKVYHQGTPPNVRNGDWLMNCTMEFAPLIETKVTGLAYCLPHCKFHRIVSIDEGADAGGAYVQFEVEPKVLPPIRTTPGTTIYPGSALFMDGLVEVFEQGPRETTP